MRDVDSGPAPRTPTRGDPVRVVVTDIDISFGQMVGLILKFTVALVPAAIILVMLGVMIALVLPAVKGTGNVVQSSTSPPRQTERGGTGSFMIEGKAYVQKPDGSMVPLGDTEATTSNRPP